MGIVSRRGVPGKAAGGGTPQKVLRNPGDTPTVGHKSLVSFTQPGVSTGFLHTPPVTTPANLFPSCFQSHPCFLSAPPLVAPLSSSGSHYGIPAPDRGQSPKPWRGLQPAKPGSGVPDPHSSPRPAFSSPFLSTGWKKITKRTQTQNRTLPCRPRRKRGLAGVPGCPLGGGHPSLSPILRTAASARPAGAGAAAESRWRPAATRRRPPPWPRRSCRSAAGSGRRHRGTRSGRWY